MQQIAIAKPYRHLKVGYFRKRHEDRKTKIPTHYSVHAALSLKGTGLNKPDLPQIRRFGWVLSMEKSSSS